MKLHFIVGGEGSGKTDRLYEELLSAESRKEENILIVPEQGNLTAERVLCERSSGRCMMYSQITSFHRLRYLLTSELGDSIPETVQDSGKSMMLALLLKRNREQLCLYRGKEKKQGFVGEMRSILSEMGQFAVTGDELLAAGEKLSADPILKNKIADIANISRIFDTFLGERDNITEEQVYTEMVPLVEKSAKLADKKLFLDGFTGFTPCELKLLDAMFRKVSDCFITVTMDPEQYGKENLRDDLFLMSRKMISDLTRLCKEAGGTVEPPILLEKSVTDDLSNLTANLYRRKLPIRNAMKNLNSVRILSCGSREEEVRAIVTAVRKLVVEEGLRYRDIGILSGDVEGYSKELDKVFRKAGVPFYIDYKADVMTNPIVGFLRSAVDVIRTDFKQESVCRFVKNPLSGFSVSEASELENYLLATGIRGENFYRNKKELRTYQTKHRIKNDEIASSMKKIGEALSGLSKAFSENETITSVLTALYELLQAFRVSEQAEAMSERFKTEAEKASERSGLPDPVMLRRAKEYSQIYKAVIGIMDQMAAILGDERMTADEFSDSFDAGLSELRLGVIPPQQDSVMIGDVKRSRLTEVRVLFFLGVNEGVVPGIHHASGLFSDRERRMLSDAGIVMAELQDSARYTDEFYLYLALCKATERLVLTYRRVDDDGNEMRPSNLLERIKHLFTDLEAITYSEKEFTDRIAYDLGEEFILEHVNEEKLHNPNDETKLALRLLSEKLPDESERLQSGYFYERTPAGLSEETAGELYGEKLFGSVSRMESYAGCPFAQFASYGLNLEERPVYGLKASDVGLIFHDILHKVLETITEDAKKSAKETGENPVAAVKHAYRELTEEQIHEMVSSEIGRTRETDQGMFSENARFNFQLTLMQEKLENTIKAVCKHIRLGDFAPYRFEYHFTVEDEAYEFNGVVDRYDMSEENGEKLARVLDYKSSGKGFNLVKCYDGVQIQLPTYLNAVCDKEKASPAGAFYMTVDDPFVDASEDDDKVRDEREKAMRPDGFLREDHDILKRFDHFLVNPDGTLTSNYESGTVNIAVTGSGKINGQRKKTAFSKEQIKTILDYVEKRTGENSNEILLGNIEAYPYEGNCTYCDYKSLCGFKKKYDEERPKSFTGKPKAEEILAAMKDCVEGKTEENSDMSETIDETEEGNHGEN